MAVILRSEAARGNTLLHFQLLRKSLDSKEAEMTKSINVTSTILQKRFSLNQSQIAITVLNYHQLRPIETKFLKEIYPVFGGKSGTHYIFTFFLFPPDNVCIVFSKLDSDKIFHPL